MWFKEAFTRLKEIHALLQSEELFDVEEIVVLQKEAKICYDLCQEKLKKAVN